MLIAKVCLQCGKAYDFEIQIGACAFLSCHIKAIPSVYDTAMLYAHTSTCGERSGMLSINATALAVGVP